MQKKLITNIILYGFKTFFVPTDRKTDGRTQPLIEELFLRCVVVQDKISFDEFCLSLSTLIEQENLIIYIVVVVYQFTNVMVLLQRN